MVFLFRNGCREVSRALDRNDEFSAISEGGIERAVPLIANDGETPRFWRIAIASDEDLFILLDRHRPSGVRSMISNLRSSRAAATVGFIQDAVRAIAHQGKRIAS